MSDQSSEADASSFEPQQPVIALRGSVVVELQAGATYLWCACGRSNNQPFCDGSHEGTGFEPVEFTVGQTKRYPMCLCKHTADAPFCDAAHRKLPLRQR